MKILKLWGKHLLLVATILFINLIQIFVFSNGDFGFGLEYENIKSLEEVKIGGVQDNQEENILDVIKNATNWVLGILALIALIFVIYGGFLMLIASGDEEKYKKGRTILKNAGFSLLFIGVAWFILSLIFWLIHLVSADAGVANSLQ